METEPTSFLTQLNSLWNRMTSSERLVVISSGLILVIAMVIWLSFSGTKDLALLYGNLEPTDAGEVITELQGRGVTYKVRDGGKAIMVPADQVDELRISLASDGFTPTGITGYELFDRSTMGMSDFLQRQNRTRAVEGELARTLMSLDEVSAARVHLTLPEPTPFIAEQIEPMASVVLQISPPGAAMSGDKIAAVRTFVAGAIGSLDPDNVTIIDQNMNLLTGPSMMRPSGLLPSQEEARRLYELQRAAGIRSLLERAYGVGNVAVSFTCEMDFDQVQSESLTYEPVPGTAKGVVVSEERTETSQSGGATAAVGIPGTESNIPSYPSAVGQPSESDSSTETKNYEVSTTHEMRTQAPGTLLSCSVGVLIDSTDRSDIGANEIAEVQSLIKDSAGLDTESGDSITIAFRPFDTTLQEELAAEKAIIASKEMRDFIFRVGVVLLVLGVFMMVLKHFLKPIEKAFLLPGFKAEKEEEAAELPSADPETREKIRMRDEIERLIREDPSAAAKVIKTWLRE